jgi:hypothetical protein
VIPLKLTLKKGEKVHFRFLVVVYEGAKTHQDFEKEFRRFEKQQFLLRVCRITGSIPLRSVVATPTGVSSWRLTGRGWWRAISSPSKPGPCGAWFVSTCS